MPLVAEASVKLGVTVKPSGTALSSVAVNVIASPSSAAASATVNMARESRLSSRMVPVAVSVAVTANDVPERLRLTVKVSSDASTVSAMVATAKVCVSPALPAKATAAVFSV